MWIFCVAVVILELVFLYALGGLPAARLAGLGPIVCERAHKTPPIPYRECPRIFSDQVSSRKSPDWDPETRNLEIALPDASWLWQPAYSIGI